MKLSPYLKHNGVAYECTLCERYFNHKAALYNHCRQTSRHAWCERCSRVFPSTSAKDTHLRESSAHHFCSRCPQTPDFETGEDLQDHLVESHHYCPDCDICCHSEGQLQEHNVEKHHLCIKCGIYFASKNNLQMHQQKHQPRNLECHGCYQTFKTSSGMLTHLESGNCASGVTKEEIDDIAHDCFQSRQYIRDDLGNGQWIYICPTCDKGFLKLSALYQHAEDVALCSPAIKGHGCLTKLERFIARCLHS